MKDLKELFKNRGFLILLGATVVVVIILAIVFIIGNKNDDDAPVTTEAPAFEVAMPEYEYNNPKDYSQIEPGTEFYDSFWNGTVTVVGSVDDLTLDQVYAGADGRLVTVQDGMYIYVDREGNAESDDRTFVDDISPGDIPEEEAQSATDDEDDAFYSNTPSVVLGYEQGAAVNSGKIAPPNVMGGVRYAIGRFLDDMSIEGVNSVTVLANSINFAENPRSYVCSFDNDPDKGVTVAFDWNTCMWLLSLTENPQKKATYNPLAFVAPSMRESACNVLNEYMGYDAFSVDDISLPDIKIEEPEPEPEKKAETEAESQETAAENQKPAEAQDGGGE